MNVEEKHAYWTGVLSRDYSCAEGLHPNMTAEQRKKYWDKFDHITHCSNCLAMFDDRDVKNWKACPYCMAIMDAK